MTALSCVNGKMKIVMITTNGSNLIARELKIKVHISVATADSWNIHNTIAVPGALVTKHSLLMLRLLRQKLSAEVIRPPQLRSASTTSVPEDTHVSGLANTE